MNLKLKKTDFFLLLLIAFGNCYQKTNELLEEPKGQYPAAPITDTTQKNYFNITYVPNSTHPRHRFDLYMPNTEIPYKGLVILVHGGGFSGGPNDQTNASLFKGTNWDVVLPLRNAGYACVIMKYRLPLYYPTYHDEKIVALPSQGFFLQNVLADIDSMTRYWQINYRNFAATNNKMALLGESAGGYFVLMDAFKNRNPYIRTVISFYAPTDLSYVSSNKVFNDKYSGEEGTSFVRDSLYLQIKIPKIDPLGRFSVTPYPGLRNNIFSIYEDAPFNTWFYAIRAFDCMIGNTNFTATTNINKLRYNQSPVKFVNDTILSIPTFLLHGKHDKLIKREQTLILGKKLGIPIKDDYLPHLSSDGRHRYQIYPGGHGWINSGGSTSNNPPMNTIYQDIIAWLGQKM